MVLKFQKHGSIILIHIIYILQIIVGKKRKSSNDTEPRKRKQKKNTARESEPQILTLEISERQPALGDFVALFVDEYEDELPQIAQLVAINESEITVNWWIGSYSGVWAPWRNRGKTVCETFGRQCLLTVVNFTKTNRLPKEIVLKFKNLYDSHQRTSIPE